MKTRFNKEVAKLTAPTLVRISTLLGWVPKYKQTQALVAFLDGRVENVAVKDAIIKSYLDAYDVIEHIGVKEHAVSSRAYTLECYRHGLYNELHVINKATLEQLHTFLNKLANDTIEIQLASSFGHYNRRPPVPTHIQCYMLEKHPKILPYVVSGVSEDIAIKYAPQIWGAWTSLHTLYIEDSYEQRRVRWEEFVQTMQSNLNNASVDMDLPEDLSNYS